MDLLGRCFEVAVDDVLLLLHEELRRLGNRLLPVDALGHAVPARPVTAVATLQTMVCGADRRVTNLAVPAAGKVALAILAASRGFGLGRRL